MSVYDLPLSIIGIYTEPNWQSSLHKENIQTGNRQQGFLTLGHCHFGPGNP